MKLNFEILVAIIILFVILFILIFCQLPIFLENKCLFISILVGLTGLITVSLIMFYRHPNTFNINIIEDMINKDRYITNKDSYLIDKDSYLINKDNIIVAPCFGTIKKIGYDAKEKVIRIAITLQLTDIHRQYFPVNGKIISQCRDENGRFNQTESTRCTDDSRISSTS